MRKEIIETGKTVDDAINIACSKLGCTRDVCEWEIIDLPKKTFLGLRVIPAKVKVSVEVPEEVKPQVEKPVIKTAPTKAVAQEKVEKPVVKREQAAPKAASSQPKKTPEPKVERDFNDDFERVLVTEGFTEKEILAMDYISGIVKEFSLETDLKLYREQSGFYVNVDGDGLGTIIGRRGETLDAIQYLTGLVANRLDGDYQRITVDCGDYRSKRKQTLEALAEKLAAQVLKTNVSKTLEPMNPFERRVIHATVSRIEGVSSMSIGEEPNRRVVINTPTSRRPSRGYRERDGKDSRDSRRGGRSDDRRPPRGRSGDRDRDRRPPSRGRVAPKPPVQEGPPKQTPESTLIGNSPMGKLDLE